MKGLKTYVKEKTERYIRNVSFDYFWAVHLWRSFILCIPVFSKLSLLGFLAQMRMEVVGLGLSGQARIATVVLRNITGGAAQPSRRAE